MIGDGNVLREHIKAPAKPAPSFKRIGYNVADFIGTLALATVMIGLVGAIFWGLAGLVAEGFAAVTR